MGRGTPEFSRCLSLPQDPLSAPPEWALKKAPEAAWHLAQDLWRPADLGKGRQHAVQECAQARPHLYPGRLLKPGMPDGLTHRSVVTELLKAFLGRKELARNRWLGTMLP